MRYLVVTVMVVFSLLFSPFTVVASHLAEDGVPMDDGVRSLSSQDIPATFVQGTRSCSGFELGFDSFDREHMSISVSPFDLQSFDVPVEGETYTQLSIKGASYTTDVGAPMLPSLVLFLAVPTTDVSIDAHVSTSHFESVSTVYPLQPPLTDNADFYQEAEFCIDGSWYRSDSHYPLEVVDISESGRIRDVDFIRLVVNPIRYYPTSNSIEVFDSISVEVSWSGDIEVNPVGTRDGYYGFKNTYQSIFLDWDLFSDTFLNDESTTQEFSNDAFTSTTDTVGCEFLIITNYTFLSAAQQLEQWKTERGFITQVVTTNDTGENETSIREYLQDAYDNWTLRPSYVLLLGDAEFIPTNYRYIHSYHGTYTGTDLWYSTLDGTDYYPDIHMARMPADTLALADMMVDNSIAYERNPPTEPNYYSNISLAAYFQDDNDDGYSDRRFTLTSEELRWYLLSIGKNVERIYKAHSSVDPTNWNSGSFGNGSAIPSELLRTNGFTWSGGPTNISNAVHQGIFILNHRDHGARWGWGDPYYSTTHISSLSNGNLQPVVFSINCQTAWFDHETDGASGTTTESFCERFVRKQNGGAVASFGASRVSYSGYNDFLTRGFYDAMFPDFDTNVGTSTPYYRMGEILDYGKWFMANTWGSWRLQFELFHVLGEPTLEIWTSQPTPLAVTHAQLVTHGNTSLQVYVFENNATVCAVQDGQIIGRGTTSNGVANIPVTPLPNGTVIITVTKHDRIPYQGYMNIFADNSPESGMASEQYGFNISELDNIDIVDVHINWTHSSLGDNISLISQGDYWVAPIVLDASTQDMTYSIFVKDTSNNYNISSIRPITVIDDVAPVFSINNADTGTTGDPFTFNISASDNTDVTTVHINWTHAGLAGNLSLSEVDDFWLATAPLDHSLTDLIYTAYVCDAGNNYNISDPQNANVLDNDLPTFDDDSIGPGTTGDTFTFNISASDNIDVDNIYVNWNHGDLSGNVSVTAFRSSWPTPVVLDHSLDDITYTVFVKDTSDNFNISVPQTVQVFDNDLPSFDDQSPGEGTTGDTFNFEIGATDNIDVGDVHVNWSHGALSENTSLTPSGGRWLVPIILDDSLSDLSYTIYVADTSDNFNISEPVSITISDNDPPVFSYNCPDVGTTGDPYTFNISASDNIDIHSVHIHWTHAGLDSNISLESDDGYWKSTIALAHSLGDMTYRLYVNDSSGHYNIGEMRTVTITDNDIPLCSDYTLDDGGTGGAFIFNISADDNIGVQSVNVNWSHGSLGQNVTLDKVGDFFLANIVLDANDVGDLTYVIYVNDASDNYNISSIQDVAVSDTIAPVANAGDGFATPQFDLIELDASGSTDNIGIVNFTWSFFDGIEILLYDEVSAYTFTHIDVSQVTLTVKDLAGNIDSTIISINVTDGEAPLADAGVDKSIDEGTIMVLDGNGSNDNVGIVNFTWTFEYGEEQIELYGAAPGFNFSRDGEYNITLTVSDAMGNSAQDTVTITVIEVDGQDDGVVDDDDDPDAESGDDQDDGPGGGSGLDDDEGSGLGSFFSTPNWLLLIVLIFVIAIIATGIVVATRKGPKDKEPEVSDSPKRTKVKRIRRRGAGPVLEGIATSSHGEDDVYWDEDDYPEDEPYWDEPDEPSDEVAWNDEDRFDDDSTYEEDPVLGEEDIDEDIDDEDDWDSDLDDEDDSDLDDDDDEDLSEDVEWE